MTQNTNNTDGYIISRAQAEHFTWEGINGWSYTTSEHSCQSKVTYFEIDNLRAQATNSNSDRFYYILGGSGYFVIEGDAKPVGPDDLVIIPTGVNFSYEPDKGETLKMLLLENTQNKPITTAEPPNLSGQANVPPDLLNPNQNTFI